MGQDGPVASAARDPVSEAMDAAARVLLDRAYRAHGAWAGSRLADPTPAQMARWLTHGINVLGPDPVQRGGFNARSRWCRAFVRALWYQHKWFSGAPGGGWRPEPRATFRTPGIQVEVGVHRATLGVIPAGRVVRVRLADKKAAEANGRPRDRWAWADGDRRSEPERRDWPAFG
jgi:hypothetical protein